MYGTPEHVVVENAWHDGPRAGIAGVNIQTGDFRRFADGVASAGLLGETAAVLQRPRVADFDRARFIEDWKERLTSVLVSPDAARWDHRCLGRASGFGSPARWTIGALDTNGVPAFMPACGTSLSRLASMLQRIHHVAIICSDYQASKRFYVETLGLAVIAENYRDERNSYKLDLALPDGGRLELFSFADAPPRPSYPEARGLRHLAFAVADVERTRALLESRGVAVEPVRIDEYTQRRFTFFADPDGLPLEIYEV